MVPVTVMQTVCEYQARQSGAVLRLRSRPLSVAVAVRRQTGGFLRHLVKQQVPVTVMRPQYAQEPYPIRLPCRRPETRTRTMTDLGNGAEKSLYLYGNGQSYRDPHPRRAGHQRWSNPRSPTAIRCRCASAETRTRTVPVTDMVQSKTLQLQGVAVQAPKPAPATCR